MDQFIPNRLAMGLGFDRCMLTKSNGDIVASSWLPDSLSQAHENINIQHRKNRFLLPFLQVYNSPCIQGHINLLFVWKLSKQITQLNHNIYMSHVIILSLSL